jgi:phosphoribosyl-ATP pyrophosphohydrolase/phosphoribosyl-AMP cyclohydrolase
MIDIAKIDFEKSGGLAPAIITDKHNGSVLMLGYMNREALVKTIETGYVTFYSRSKQRLWKKGETSGNCLKLTSIKADCDNDALLVQAEPTGPTCHTGSYSCFGEKQNNSLEFLNELFALVKQRKAELPENSYTTELFKSGANRIIQKVGEEAVETVIAAKNRDKNEIINEVSDLMFHMFVMLAEQEIEFTDIVDNLESRHRK